MPVLDLAVIGLAAAQVTAIGTAVFAVYVLLFGLKKSRAAL